MAFASTDFPLFIEAAPESFASTDFPLVIEAEPEPNPPVLESFADTDFPLVIEAYVEPLPSFPDTDFPLIIVEPVAWTRLATIIGNTYDDEDVTPGATYQYRVVKTTTGETLYSDEVVALANEVEPISNIVDALFFGAGF